MYSLLKASLKYKGLAANLIFILTLLFSAAGVSAHTKLLRSQPADGETLRQAPETIELTFSEELQNVSVNTIVVTDHDGRRVDKNTVVVSEDGKRILTELDALSDGSYTVEWKALSADDHTMKGKYTFKVALPANNNTATVTTPEQPPGNDKMRMNHQMPAQESGTNRAQSAVRWLTYLAMMTLFGGFAFWLLVLKPSIKKVTDLSDEERALGLKQGENRFIRLTWLALALLAVAAFASLILQTSSVMDVSITQGFAPSRLFQVLTETSFGAPWLVQIAVTLALFVIVIFIARGRRNNESGQNVLNARMTLLWISFAFSVILFLTPSLTGHARAAAGEYRFAVFADWLHLVAAGIWVGGLFQVALTLPKSLAVFDYTQRLRVLSRVIPLFSRLAASAVILIALTGIYNSWIHVDGFSALWNTTYGMILTIKIILFLPMLALGALNTLVLRPRDKRLIAEAISANENQKADRIFYRSVRIEATFGIVILLLAAILAFLPPAREHEMMMSNKNFANLQRND